MIIPIPDPYMGRKYFVDEKKYIHLNKTRIDEN